MHKFFIRLLPAIALLGCTMLQSCDDDDSPAGNGETPFLNVEVESVQRTQASFTIRSGKGVDYAYLVAEKGSIDEPTAQEIFENGVVGQLDLGIITPTTFDIEGGKEYVVYTAVRRINPYIYSDVVTTPLSTDIPYTSLVTLDKVGLTEISYHIEVPEGARVKHVLVKKADYLAVKNIIGSLGEFNAYLYTKVFGLSTTENVDRVLDKTANDGLDNQSNIHVGTTYLLMAGIVDSDGEIIKDSFEYIEFDTRKAAESPYNIDYTVLPSSNRATVTITPDPEIVEYRVLVESKAEFDYSRAEGEAQLRNLIVGNWDDSKNTPKRIREGAVEFDVLALVPNSEYVLGIIGFDDQRREKFILYNFITGEPTGPKPTATVTEVQPSVEAPWSTKAYNVKVTNTVEVRYGFFINSQIQQLLYNGSQLANVIRANGEVCSNELLAQLLSSEGAVFETDNLAPKTEYMFAVYAVNDEYVATVAYDIFTTDELPQVGGTVRKNMPGTYTASTTDEDGNPVTFPVTIATGVDEATSSQYSAQNRLVCLGFGPTSVCPYKSPLDLVATGVDPDEAYKIYGPKWFIEFTEDNIYVPKCSNKSWVMYNYEGTNCYLGSYGIRYAGSRPIEMRPDVDFKVEVSDDGNTITIKGEWLSTGSGCYLYPAMYYTSGSGWMQSYNYPFMATSDIVLTRQENPANNASLRRMPLITPPAAVEYHLGTPAADMRSQRTAVASQIR